jgi:hypothetical protein
VAATGEESSSKTASLKEILFQVSEHRSDQTADCCQLISYVLRPSSRTSDRPCA